MLKPRKVFSHPPSAICPFPISPSQSLPLQTLRLVSLVSLITKTLRIAQRSAIMTGRQEGIWQDERQTEDPRWIYDRCFLPRLRDLWFRLMIDLLFLNLWIPPETRLILRYFSSAGKVFENLCILYIFADANSNGISISWWVRFPSRITGSTAENDKPTVSVHKSYYCININYFFACKVT
jgi:hypothetical protein